MRRLTNQRNTGMMQCDVSSDLTICHYNKKEDTFLFYLGLTNILRIFVISFSFSLSPLLQLFTHNVKGLYIVCLPVSVPSSLFHSGAVSLFFWGSSFHAESWGHPNSVLMEKYLHEKTESAVNFHFCLSECFDNVIFYVCWEISLHVTAFCVIDYNSNSSFLRCWLVLPLSEPIMWKVALRRWHSYLLNEYDEPHVED